jgi:hypothetical protein
VLNQRDSQDLNRLYSEYANNLQEENLAAVAFYQESVLYTQQQQTRPSVLFKPKLFPDGALWCALYGENLQEGLTGFGETPELAMQDFDRNFITP